MLLVYYAGMLRNKRQNNYWRLDKLHEMNGRNLSGIVQLEGTT